MKKFLTFILILLSVAAATVSCTKNDEPGSVIVTELNTDAVEYYLIEIDRYLALKDNPDSGYSAESFAALEAEKEALEAILAGVKDGTVTSQADIDSAAAKAEAVVKEFKDSYHYQPRPAELYVPGAEDISNYIKLGDPGAFDGIETITVSFWFKGAEKLNIQRQGSIISNFVSDGSYYGWEINTWASDEQGNGGYRLRVSRAFGGNDLREPSGDFTNHTEWHHIAYTFDNSSHYTALYLDGNKIGDDTHDAAPKRPGYNVQMCAFKSLTDAGNPKSVSGSIKNLRFWDRALSVEEVAADMTAEVTGSEDGLIAAWDFTNTVDDPTNVMDKTGRHRAQILGDKVEWREIE